MPRLAMNGTMAMALSTLMPGAGMCMLAGQDMPSEGPAQVTAATADALDVRFRNLPWSRDASTLAARREAFDTADILLRTMNDKAWKSYLRLSSGSADEKAEAGKIEQDAPLPHFIGLRLQEAIGRIQKRPMPDNLVGVTYLYNHGFVIEVGGKRLGIDLVGPGLEELAESLDALIVSHWHEDHFNEALLTAMLSKGKAVFACGYSGSPESVRKTKGGTLLMPQEGERATVGPMLLTFHLGDHYPPGFVKYNPQIKVSEKGVLDTLLEIRLPELPRPLVLFHDGDDFNPVGKRSAVSGKSVDVFLGHGVPSPTLWADPQSKSGMLWRDLNESIGDPFATALAIEPRLFIPGHMAERNHGDNIGGCTPFSVAVAFCDLLDKETGGKTMPIALMWGETILVEMAPDGKIGVRTP